MLRALSSDEGPHVRASSLVESLKATLHAESSGKQQQQQQQQQRGKPAGLMADLALPFPSSGLPSPGPHGPQTPSSSNPRQLLRSSTTATPRAVPIGLAGRGLLPSAPAPIVPTPRASAPLLVPAPPPAARTVPSPRSSAPQLPSPPHAPMTPTPPAQPPGSRTWTRQFSMPATRATPRESWPGALGAHHAGHHAGQYATAEQWAMVELERRQAALQQQEHQALLLKQQEDEEQQAYLLHQQVHAMQMQMLEQQRLIEQQHRLLQQQVMGTPAPAWHGAQQASPVRDPQQGTPVWEDQGESWRLGSRQQEVPAAMPLMDWPHTQQAARTLERSATMQPQVNRSYDRSSSMQALGHTFDSRIPEQSAVAQPPPQRQLMRCSSLKGGRGLTRSASLGVRRVGFAEGSGADAEVTFSDRGSAPAKPITTPPKPAHAPVGLLSRAKAESSRRELSLLRSQSLNKRRESETELLPLLSNGWETLASRTATRTLAKQPSISEAKTWSGVADAKVLASVQAKARQQREQRYYVAKAAPALAPPFSCKESVSGVSVASSRHHNDDESNPFGDMSYM